MRQDFLTNYKLQAVLLLGLAVLAFFPYLGGVHLFDWDEINFAEISREMLVSGDWSRVQMGFQPFFEKPPLFFWLQAMSMQVFGIGEFAARFPNAVCGIVTLSVLIWYGKQTRNLRFGVLWAGMYFGSLLPHLYFRSGIIDPWFNLFMLGCILFALESNRTIRSLQNPFLILSGVSAGLAILTKGPVGILIPGLVILAALIWQRVPFLRMLRMALWIGVPAILTASTWFGAEWALHGPAFIREFVAYQWDLLVQPGAGHSGFPGYHFVMLLAGCFPASIFALPSLWHRNTHANTFNPQALWMKLLLIIVLIVFTLVRSKIVHYSSMAYFPVTFFAAVTFDQVLSGSGPIPRWVRNTVFIFGLLISMIFCIAWIELEFGFIRQSLPGTPEIQAFLDLEVSPGGYECLPAVLMLLTITIFTWHFNRKRIYMAVLILCAGMGLTIEAALYSFIGKVEAFSQRSLISFYQEHAEKDAYLYSYRFKTYTHVYYGKATPATACWGKTSEWILDGEIDKPVYFAARLHRAGEVTGIQGVIELGHKGGYTFFVRNPVRFPAE